MNTTVALVIIVGLLAILLWFVYSYVTVRENLLIERREQARRLREANELYREKYRVWQEEKDRFLDEVSRLRTSVEEWTDRALMRAGQPPIQQRNRKTPATASNILIPSSKAQAAAVQRFKNWNPSEEDSDFG